MHLDIQQQKENKLATIKLNSKNKIHGLISILKTLHPLSTAHKSP